MSYRLKSLPPSAFLEVEVVRPLVVHPEIAQVAATLPNAPRRVVELDRSYQMEILDHPDLEPLRASWGGTE